MANLKLGRLPKLGTVRLTITLPEALKDELERYTAEYSRFYAAVDVPALIPHMLEAFLRSDRGWRSCKAQAVRRRQPDAATEGKPSSQDEAMS
jgi:hypothetical protein